MSEFEQATSVKTSQTVESDTSFDVLLIEDNPVDARLVEQYLGSAARPDHYNLHHAGSAEAALAKIGERRFDAILLDLELPDATGLDTFAALSSAIGDVPVLVLTGHDDGELGIRALQLGAQDYLIKSNLDPALLQKSLRYAIERSRMHRELENSRRLSTLGRLASSVAHEFNNVLMAIQPFAELIARQSRGNERIETAVQHINDAIRRGKGISSEILRYARPSPPDKKTVDVLSWFNDLREQLSHAVKAPTTLSFELPRERLLIDGDRVQLTHSIANLVANASEATKPGGSITVAARRLDPSADLTWPDVRSHEPMAVVSVSDTGAGIPPEGMQRLFEPLFTTKRNGTGLGLPVVLQTVQAHGGDIRVRSTVGEGTTVSFILPLSGRAAEEVVERRHVSPEIRRVVLVEDDEGVAAGLEQGLRSNGIETFVANRGGLAVAAVEEHGPQAVILDVGLPDMSGVDVFDQLAARWPNLPVVFSTGHESLSLLARRTAAPHVAYLTKPYAIAELVAVLGIVIASVS